MPSKERACAWRWAGAAPRHEPCPALGRCCSPPRATPGACPCGCPTQGSWDQALVRTGPEVPIKRTKALLVRAPRSRCGQLVPARSRLTQSWHFGNSFQTGDVGVSVRRFAR